MPTISMRRRTAWLAVAAWAALGGHATAAVTDALERPAIRVQRPERAVLLGAALAGSRIVAVGERGLVIVSDDGGRQWRQAASPVSVSLTAVRFADPANGYATGHGGTVLATNDGGLTWSRRLDGRRLAQVALAAAQASGDAATQKWAQRLADDGPDKPLLDLLVLDAKRVLVVGAYGLALSTHDGGVTWSSWRPRLDNPRELHLYAVRQRGSSLVIAGEQGLLLQSSDGGQSFRRITTPYAGSFFTVELPDEQTIVAAGLRGNAWRSPDAGARWAQLATPAPASITASASGTDGRMLFVNQAGMVLGLAGDALEPLADGAQHPLNAILPLDRTRAVALSVQGVLPLNLRAP